VIYKHIPDVRVKAKFSDCKKFRYQLTIENKLIENGTALCVLMQNPSIADDKIADKSVQFLETLIFHKNYPEFEKVSHFTIVNQFARIQTKDFEGKDKDIGPDNDLYIRKAIQQSNIILIAWGKSNPYSKRQQDILSMITSFERKKVFMTKKHPSRGTYHDFLRPFKN